MVKMDNGIDHAIIRSRSSSSVLLASFHAGKDRYRKTNIPGPIVSINVIKMLLIGTCLCLISVIRAYHKQAEKYKKDIEEQRKQFEAELQKQQPNAKEIYKRARDAAFKPIDPKAGY